MRDQVITSSYLKFCEAQGNQHIASEYAVRKIIYLIQTFRIKNILEVGLGIGSIAGTVLKTYKKSSLHYCGTENNDFCLGALEKNLGKEYLNLNIYSEIQCLELVSKFELIIIDGSDEHLEGLRNLTSENAIIAIEGDRELQISTLKRKFPNSIFVHSISKKLNSIHSPFSSHHWQGGIKFIFVEPTYKQKIWCIKEKIKTKFKYWYRSIH